jgi:regulatory protein
MKNNPHPPDTTGDEAIPDQYPKARDAALNFLSYRARSEAEVRRRLSRSYPDEVIDRVILFLQKHGYLNDAAFAQLWRQAREHRHPKGRRALQHELLRFGIDREVIEEALEGFDAGTNAYNACRRIAARLAAKGLSQALFRQKLGPYLQRRGFNYGVISETMNLLWQELTPQTLPGEINPDCDE